MCRKTIGYAFFLALLIVNISQGEVILDGSLGSGGALRGPNYAITADLGHQADSNLFHSFSQFNIDQGESATFSGPVTVKNILGRVTGGNQSAINGLLRSTIPGANLYLINPSGIIFGANAALDITGSFHSTTADYIKLSDGIRFNAVPSAEDGLLTAASPLAFGFLQDNPAPISVDRASLEVKQGKTISLVGGNLSVVGTDEQTNLTAPSGQINLLSVASPGEAVFEQSNHSDNLTTDTFKQLGSIAMSHTGGFANLLTTGNPGGKIYIRSGLLSIQGGGIQSSSTGDIDPMGIGVDIAVTDKIIINAQQVDTEIASSSRDSGKAGDIIIETGRLEMFGGEETGIGIGARVFGSGDGGNITIKTESLDMANNAFISAQVFDSGNGGDIKIDSRELQIDGSNQSSFISAATFASGAAGNLEVNAAIVKLVDGTNGFTGLTSQITGIKDIDPDDIDIAKSGGSSSFNSGNITLNISEKLEIEKGAQISSTIFEGTGNAGEININAQEIVVSGSTESGIPSGIFAETSNTATGNGADILISSNSVHLTDGGRISTFSQTEGDSGNIALTTQQLNIENGAFISTASVGFGKAGAITILANEINFTGMSANQSSGLASFSSVFASGGGNITLNTNSLKILDGAKIFSATFGSGAGGDIDITANSVLVSGINQSFKNSSAIDAQSIAFPGFEEQATGDGGNIRIQANQINLANGGLITTSSSSDGNAGNISLSGRQLTQDSGFIRAQTNKTDGGNIMLTFSDFIHLFDSQITTSVGGMGNGGNIFIDPIFIVMDNSQIIADAVQGNGGNIRIIVDHFFKSPDSLISASSQLGIDGEIIIDSPNTNIIASIELLPADFLDVASILSTPCAQRSAKDISHFVIRKFEVLPDSPYALRTFQPDFQLAKPHNHAESLLSDRGC